MLAIDDAKLPPPNPAVAAINSSTANGRSGCVTAHASPRHGTTSRSAEITVQLRPPKIGTAKVYGSRRTAPTPLGTATNHNAWLALSANPDAAALPLGPAIIWTTTMLHNSHAENPMCSAKIDQIKLRRAIGLPTVSQNFGSSGRQSSIQLSPRFEGSGRAGASGGVAVMVMSKLRSVRADRQWPDDPICSGEARHFGGASEDTISHPSQQLLNKTARHGPHV